MNAEKIYTAAAEIIRYCLMEDTHNDKEQMERAERIYKKILNDPADWTRNGYGPICSAAAILMEARAAMDAKTTSAGKLAALKRCVKDAPSGWGGQFEQGEKWYICDGYRLYSSPEKFPESIPTIDQHTNVTRFIPNLNKYRKAPETVTRAALKEYAARPEYKNTKNKRNRRPFVIAANDTRIGISPEYLLDAWTIYPDAEIYLADRYDPAALVQNGEVVAIVQPCRTDESWEVNAA